MRKISLIVIHCSATRVDRDFTAKDVDTAHRFRGFSCWGYHYYIRKSGQIEPMRDEDTVGAHARGFNAISLGRQQVAIKAAWRVCPFSDDSSSATSFCRYRHLYFHSSGY